MRETNYGRWENKEVSELFATVEQFKNKGQPISKAFNDYAQKHDRQTNSVRNYYYAELNALYEDTKRANDLKINLKKHSKQVFTPFKENESSDLIKTIICNLSRGKSVRSTCLELSGGDVGKMIRYQNKYRSALKSNTNLVKAIMKKLDETGKKYVNPLQMEETEPKTLAIGQNILQMPRKSKITEADLSSLFLGVMQLIKRTAEEEIASKLKSECEFANSTLRKTIVTLNEKEKIIKSLTTVNSELKHKVGELAEKLKQYRAGTYSLKSELERIKNKKTNNVGVINTL